MRFRLRGDFELIGQSIADVLMCREWIGNHHAKDGVSFTAMTWTDDFGSGYEGLSLQELPLLYSHDRLAHRPVFLRRMRALVAQLTRHISVIQNVDFRGTDQLESGELLDDIGQKSDFFDALLYELTDTAPRDDTQHGVQAQKERRP